MRVTQSQSAIEFIENSVDYAVAPIIQGQKQVPQLESVASVSDDDWNQLEQQTNEWEQQQQSIPEDADNPEAYKVFNRKDEADYWAKITQKGNHSNPTPPPVSSADIRSQVQKITQSMSMANKSVKAARLEERRIAFWNNQLRSGDTKAIAIATKQALEAGYQIVDGQVKDVEF